MKAHFSVKNFTQHRVSALDPLPTIRVDTAFYYHPVIIFSPWENGLSCILST